MRVQIVVFFLVVGSSPLFARSVTDMTGRKVDIPDVVERILPYDAKTSILVYALLKDKMVATPILPGKKNYQYITKGYAELPEADVKNVEEVLTYAPQVILYGVYDKNENTNAVVTLGKRLNIPVLFVDLSIDKLDESYLFLGEVFFKKKECQVFISYLRDLYHLVDSIKQSGKPAPGSVYYSLGATGLLTDPSGSKHTEVLDYMGISNAAKVAIPSGGHAKVNLEQVLMWNPAYIFTSDFRGDASAYQIIASDSKWKGIQAVKNKRVYKIPVEPLGWFDHPPSVNRIPGVLWMCEVFYHLSRVETMRRIQQFYLLFYEYALSQEEYNLLFK